MTLAVNEVNVELAREFSIRGAVFSPIKVFHLDELGINSASFLARIGPTFQRLPFDPYDPALSAERLVRTHCPEIYQAHEIEWLSFWNELSDYQFTNPLAGSQFWMPYVKHDHLRQVLSELRPHRRRSCFQFLMDPRTSREYLWRVREIGVPTFAQNVSDVRARPRRFAPSPSALYRDEEILRLIGMACQLVCQTASVLTMPIRVTLHQMLTYADRASGRDPAPEGTHQDGSSFIVSALVIERNNVEGGISKVYYAKDEGLALNYQLRPGEGILQSDLHNEYWHSITAIYPKDPAKIGFRSILGLDLDLIGDRKPAWR